MTSPRPLSALNGLTSDDLNLLASWLDQHPYRKVVELAEAKFQRAIPKTTLQRFAARNSARTLLDDSPDSLEAASEINQFAATARTAFSDATLHVLERRAFELVLIVRTEKQMASLKDLLFLSHKHRSTQVRERQVKVQEEKLALRQAEKQKPDYDPAVQTFTDRLHHAFKNHPLFSPAPNPNPNPPPSIPNENCPIPPVQSSPNLTPPLAPPSLDPPLAPATPPPPSDSQKSHTIRRWLSYLPRPPGTPAPDETWTDECPCGSPLPCDLHADLWRSLRYLKPWHPDYTAALQQNHLSPFIPSPSDLTPPNPNLPAPPENHQTLESPEPSNHKSKPIPMPVTAPS